MRRANSADFVIDVRCLPNPYWSGEACEIKQVFDKGVQDFVFSFDESGFKEAY